MENKIAFIDSYIASCEKIYHETDAESLINDIVGVLSSEIPNLKENLTYYGHYIEGVGSQNYVADCKLLMMKLQNYKFNLEREDKIRNDELEKLKLQKSISINNTTQNYNTSSSTSSAEVSIKFEQLIENISSISNESLNIKEKEDLLALLSLIEMNKKNKSNISEQVSKVLKFIADKGLDVIIAVLPYLCGLAWESWLNMLKYVRYELIMIYTDKDDTENQLI